MSDALADKLKALREDPAAASGVDIAVAALAAGRLDENDAEAVKAAAAAAAAQTLADKLKGLAEFYRKGTAVRNAIDLGLKAAEDGVITASERKRIKAAITRCGPGSSVERFLTQAMNAGEEK